VSVSKNGRSGASDSLANLARGGDSLKKDLFEAEEPASSFQKKIIQSKIYSEFKAALAKSNCQLCALHKGRTQIVVDRGNPKASLMMIGEGPGENEDLQGKAFVGRAGRLLDQLCEEVGIRTDEDALIANVVKCRPPGNRAPLKEEAQTCIAYLKRQIELVNPKVLVLLGATAIQHLLPARKKEPVSKLVGHFFEDDSFRGIKLFLLFHPAYILRDPRKKPLMLEMLRKLKHEL